MLLLLEIQKNIINTQTGELHEWPATLTPGVNANGYEMHYADLRNADLSNASLQETEFTNADLRFADLSAPTYGVHVLIMQTYVLQI